jgi:hypothetical protein
VFICMEPLELVEQVAYHMKVFGPLIQVGLRFGDGEVLTGWVQGGLGRVHFVLLMAHR